MATPMILVIRHTQNDAESQLCMSMHHLYLSNTTSTTVQMLYKCHSYMNLVKCLNQFTEISCKYSDKLRHIYNSFLAQLM